jgi:hypothetical protein
LTGRETRTIPLSDVRAVRFGYCAKSDALAEFVFGMDVWDQWGRWRDHVECLLLVSFVSFVLIPRRYTESKTV